MVWLVQLISLDKLCITYIFGKCRCKQLYVIITPSHWSENKKNVIITMTTATRVHYHTMLKHLHEINTQVDTTLTSSTTER